MGEFARGLYKKCARSMESWIYFHNTEGKLHDIYSFKYTAVYVKCPGLKTSERHASID
jgi:hypothetical protein